MCGHGVVLQSQMQSALARDHRETTLRADDSSERIPSKPPLFKGIHAIIDKSFHQIYTDRCDSMHSSSPTRDRSSCAKKEFYYNNVRVICFHLDAFSFTLT